MIGVPIARVPDIQCQHYAIIEIISIEQETGPDLFLVVQTCSRVSSPSGTVQSRQQYSGKNCNDRNHR